MGFNRRLHRRDIVGIYERLILGVAAMRSFRHLAALLSIAAISLPALASAQAVVIRGYDGANVTRTIRSDAAGVLASPVAGTANRVRTHTSISLNTNTTICPTASAPVTTEIYFSTAGVGIGIDGQTLTGAAATATASNSPDIVIATAGTLYTFPVGPTNAITAYGAAGVIVCIQTLRQ